MDLPWLDNVVRTKRPQRLPVVLSRSETRDVLMRMKGVYGLTANLLYGTGMRIMECVRLRVKDVDFDRGEILVRDGKGRELEIQPIIATPLKFSAMAIENSTFFLGDHLTLLPSYRVVPANKLTDQPF